MNKLINTLVATSALLAAANLPAQSLFINDATVHTMGSKGVLQETDILVRNGEIQKIGSDLKAPADAQVIEAEGRPVTPGFFAGITDLGLVEIGAVEATADSALKAVESLSVQGFKPEFDVSPAYNPNSTLIPITRVEGFTWTQLGARSSNMVGGRGRAVLLDGGYQSFIGPDTLFLNVGGDASGESGSRAAQWMLLEQAMRESRSDASPGSDALLTRHGRQVWSDMMQNNMVVFDVDRASDIVQVLRFAGKHRINAVILGGAEAWMVADDLAEAGVPVMLNSLQNLPSNFDMLGSRMDNAALLNEAGVMIAFTGMGSHQARKLRQVAGNAVAAGLPYEVALAGLTTHPASIFGLDDDRGTLDRGSKADLVLWSGDPLEVTTVADQVIINGQLDPMVSRQTLLRDRYLPYQPAEPRAYIKP